jgi:hypothetical protein
VSDDIGQVGPSLRSDRRADQRGAAIFRPVLIEIENRAAFCLVRNISAGGMSGRVYSDFSGHLPLEVTFAPGVSVPGTLVWSRDQHIGVQFAHPIDVPSVLERLSRREIDGRVNRALRMPINCPAELVLEGRSLSVNVQDISQRGLKVSGPYLRRHEEVVVQLPGMDRRKALVRWAQDANAGLNFVRALSFDDLATWVVEIQRNAAQHGAASPEPRSPREAPPLTCNDGKHRALR